MSPSSSDRSEPTEGVVETGDPAGQALGTRFGLSLPRPIR